MLKEIVFKIGLILAFLLPLQVFTQVKPVEPEKIYLKENWFVLIGLGLPVDLLVPEPKPSAQARFGETRSSIQ